MVRFFSIYCSSLIKRFLYLCFICSFILLLLISYQYDIQSSFLLFVDILLLTSPWLLIFQQIVFSSFLTPSNLFSGVFVLIFSTIISAVLFIIIFPYSNLNFNINFENIIPNITQPKSSIIVDQQGTLIIDPRRTNMPLYSDPNTKVLFINSNLFSFNEFQTNEQSFEMRSPYLMSKNGLSPQVGVAIYPFSQGNANSPSLAQYTLQKWFDSIMLFNSTIGRLYDSLNIPTSAKNKTYNIRQKQKERNNTNTTQLSPEYQVPNNTPDNTSNNNSSESSSLGNYLNINYLHLFIAILSIFALFSFVGIALSVKQHFAGMVALITILVLSIPFLSTYFFQISILLQKLYPPFSNISIYLGIIIISYLCSILCYFLKKYYKRIPS